MSKLAPGGSMRFLRLLLFVLTPAAGAFAADSGIWKTAPPLPASWQRDRGSGLAARRHAVLVPRARAIFDAPVETSGASRGGHGGSADAAPASDPPAWTTEFARPMAYAVNQELQLYMVLPARPNAVEYRREQEFAGKLASV